MTETPVRLRVEFNDESILTKSQRTQGLRRSWILLKPQHRTIADLAAYLLHSSCPNGLLISMDEFALPPFESTCIFKDRDILSVRRRCVSEIEMIEEHEGFEVEEIEERRVFDGGMKLLASEEFEKEKGGYESELEEDGSERLDDVTTPLKKRKRLNKPESSTKKKRSKSATNGDCSVFPAENTHGKVQQEKKKSCRKRHARKISSKKEKSPTVEDDLHDSSSSEIDERTNNRSDSTPSPLQQNDINVVVSSEKPDEAKKTPSRSARRKKAKRKWLRENMKTQKEELN